MGFTRYWDNVKPSQELADAAKKIIEASDVTIKGGFGEGAPTITAEEIWLNGDASVGAEHETLLIDDSENWRGKKYSAFCKTARKPYDEVVAAILIAAAVIDEEAEIVRDGEFPFDDQAGIELYQKAVGKIPTEAWDRLAYDEDEVEESLPF